MRKFPAIVGMQPDQIEQLADARLNVALALDQIEGADRLGDNGVDPKARVEARIGILEDHLDAPAQPAAGLDLARIAHGNAVDHHFARGRRQQPDHHAGNGGFTGAGFADQRKGLALGDVEGHAVDRLQEFEMAAFQHPVEPGF